MGHHRRKWGWWLVAALAGALVASLLFRKGPDTPSGQSGPTPAVPADSSGSAPAVSDTVYVNVDGESLPVVWERKSEPLESGSGIGADAGTAPSAETVITIPVKDINGIVRSKGGRDLTLATQAPDRISVSYSGPVDIPLLGAQDMDLSADFKVVEAKGDRLVIQMDSGAAKNALADLFSSAILEHLPKGLVESFSGGRAVINLSAVPELKKRLRGVDIAGFTVDEDGIRLRTVEK